MMHHSWQWGWGWWMGLHGVVGLAILALVILGLVAVARSLFAGGSRDAARRSPALEALEQRYAKGEIDRDEYLQKKQDLKS